MPPSLVRNSSVTDRTIIMICTRIVCTRSLTFLMLLFGLGFGCPPVSHASALTSCSLEMNNRAESSLIDARRNWPSLLKHQRIFVSCDDGELGEGYSDAVVRLFAQKWGQFGSFVVLAKKHPDFQSWAVRHIDATASDEDLNKIVLNTTTCIDNIAVKNICKSIRQAAENALKESAQMRH